MASVKASAGRSPCLFGIPARAPRTVHLCGQTFRKLTGQGGFQQGREGEPRPEADSEQTCHGSCGPPRSLPGSRPTLEQLGGQHSRNLCDDLEVPTELALQGS